MVEAELGVGLHRVLDALALDAAARHLHVLAPDGSAPSRRPPPGRARAAASPSSQMRTARSWRRTGLRPATPGMVSTRGLSCACGRTRSPRRPGRLDMIGTQSTGWSPKSSFTTIGGSTSSGSWKRAWAILSRTSWAATSMSTVELELHADLGGAVEASSRPSVRTPAMVLMDSSRTSVTSSSTTSGLAPSSVCHHRDDRELHARETGRRRGAGSRAPRRRRATSVSIQVRTGRCGCRRRSDGTRSTRSLHDPRPSPPRLPEPSTLGAGSKALPSALTRRDHLDAVDESRPGRAPRPSRPVPTP